MGVFLFLCAQASWGFLYCPCTGSLLILWHLWSLFNNHWTCCLCNGLSTHWKKGGKNPDWNIFTLKNWRNVVMYFTVLDFICLKHHLRLLYSNIFLSCFWNSVYLLGSEVTVVIKTFWMDYEYRSCQLIFFPLFSYTYI